nr:hypothetical protein [Tanacetum cinerariifolium]
MRIPSWMITNEMKLTKNYQMYAKDFRVDVPITQSQPIESTQGTHKTTTIPRSPNLNVDEGESNVDEPVSSIPNSQNDPDTRLDLKSYKESSKVVITTDVQPVNVSEEEEESTKDNYELRRRVDSSVRNYMSCHILHVHPTQASQASAQERFSAIRPRDQDAHHDDAYPKGENSAKRQKTSEHGTYVMGESLSSQANEINQKGNSEPEKIVLSLHKFLTVIFPDDDTEERTSRWVNKYIEKKNKFYIVFELIYGIIYKNNKKEKRTMRHQEIHKFCDATLKRVLEGLKSYNNDVKHGYVTPSLSKEDAEYMRLFEEEIDEQLKHHDQMRR